MGHHGHLLHLPTSLMSFGGGRTKEVGAEMSSHAAAAEQQAAVPPPPPPKKGCVAVRVGQEGEEQQRFVVPVVYLTHPLFLGLLKDAEEVYGFDHKGAISIPCHVEYFRHVQGIIEKARTGAHHHHLHLHLHLTSCFGGLKA